MNYQIIKKHEKHGRPYGEPTIGIRRTTITFSKGFENAYTIGKYAEFAINENYNLCFRFSESPSRNSYKIVNHGLSLIHTPARIQALLETISAFGRYPVSQNEDGWFVTSCEIK